MPTSIARRKAAAVVAATLFASASHAETLASRHGAVNALPAGEGTFALSFEGRQLATLAAAQVSLLRVTPAGPREHIVIESWKPGLHCHKSYVLLTIEPDHATSVSRSFGDCMEIESARSLQDGVQVMLRDAGPAGARHPKVLGYTWAHGRLSTGAQAPTPPGTVK